MAWMLSGVVTWPLNYRYQLSIFWREFPINASPISNPSFNGCWCLDCCSRRGNVPQDQCRGADQSHPVVLICINSLTSCRLSMIEIAQFFMQTVVSPIAAAIGNGALNYRLPTIDSTRQQPDNNPTTTNTCSLEIKTERLGWIDIICIIGHICITCCFFFLGFFESKRGRAPGGREAVSPSVVAAGNGIIPCSTIDWGDYGFLFFFFEI